MGHWTTATSKALWERIKRDPQTHEKPPFPQKGEVDVVAMCRHTPIQLTWNCENETIVINGKPVKVLYDGAWAFKVCREGIYTNGRTADLVYDIVMECAEDGALDTMYYDMLKRAEKICKRVETPPCV